MFYIIYFNFLFSVSLLKLSASGSLSVFIIFFFPLHITTFTIYPTNNERDELLMNINNIESCRNNVLKNSSKDKKQCVIKLIKKSQS